MSTEADARIEFAVLEQAADWFARLGDDADADAHTRWRDWLAASPHHRRAWQRVEMIGSRFAQLPVAPASQALQSAAANGRVKRRQLVKALALAGVAVGIGGAFTRSRQWVQWTADFSTGIGERRDVTLADGSRLWLNSGSAADVQFDVAARIIDLRCGEVLIEQAADPRPLCVRTAAGSVLSAGQRFSVRCGRQRTQLAVFAGSVAIRTAAGREAIVAAGEQRWFSALQIDAVEPVERRREAWSRGLLVAENLQLDAFFDELSQQHRVHFAVAPTIAGLRLVGAYPLDDLDRIIATLEETLPVVVRRPLPWWVAVDARV
jgi:transmembrane sensor